MTDSTKPGTDELATARTPGFDVARALAVFGMIVVNFRSKMEVEEVEGSWLAWATDRIEGRAAALFVVLAGIGISLRSRRARQNPDRHLRFERTALLKRAAVLAVAGILNLHLWEWDILHFYAVFLAVAALLLRAPNWALGLMSATFVGCQVWLETALPYEAEHDLWTAKGLLSDLFFNGLHPVFPWMAFILLGMWLGRIDLRDRATRQRVLVFALAATVAGEAIDTISQHAEALHIDPERAAWVSGWPRPSRPIYMLSAAGAATVCTCLAISATESRPKASWVVALGATGQMAFTLYIAHAIAIVIPLQHDLFVGAPLAYAVAYSVAFYLSSIALSVWWRRRFPYGPLEGLIRQLSGRTTPAPWGGGLAGIDSAHVSTPRGAADVGPPPPSESAPSGSAPSTSGRKRRKLG